MKLDARDFNLGAQGQHLSAGRRLPQHGVLISDFGKRSQVRAGVHPTLRIFGSEAEVQALPGQSGVEDDDLNRRRGACLLLPLESLHSLRQGGQIERVVGVLRESSWRILLTINDIIVIVGASTTTRGGEHREPAATVVVERGGAEMGYEARRHAVEASDGCHLQHGEGERSVRRAGGRVHLHRVKR